MSSLAADAGKECEKPVFIFFENKKRYEHMPDGVYLGMMLLPETWEFYSVCQKSVF